MSDGASSRRSGSTSRRPSGVSSTCLSASCVSTTSSITLSTRKRSGVTVPPTTVSPSPKRGLDRDHAAVAVGRVERHRDAGRVGADHPLDDDGHLRVGSMPRSCAVGDGAVGVQARPAAVDGVQHRVLADHPQERVVLAREARVARSPRRWRSSARRPARRRRARGTRRAIAGSRPCDRDREPVRAPAGRPRISAAEAGRLAADEVDVVAVARAARSPGPTRRAATRGRGTSCWACSASVLSAHVAGSGAAG